MLLPFAYVNVPPHMESIEDLKELGRRIRVARIYSGHSQIELAGELGVTRHTIGRWEKGLLPVDRRRREDALRRIAEATGQPIEEVSNGGAGAPLVGS